MTMPTMQICVEELSLLRSSVCSVSFCMIVSWSNCLWRLIIAGVSLLSSMAQAGLGWVVTALGRNFTTCGSRSALIIITDCHWARAPAPARSVSPPPAPVRPVIEINKFTAFFQSWPELCLHLRAMSPAWAGGAWHSVLRENVVRSGHRGKKSWKILRFISSLWLFAKVKE